MYANYTLYLADLLKEPKSREALYNGLNQYPLYEPAKTVDLIPNREELNKKILNHYKYYEIGFETIGRFIDEITLTMQEIMPYYNELYKTVETIEGIDDIFGNVDMEETYTQTQTTESSNTSVNSGKSEATEKTAGSETGSTSGKKIEATTPQDNIKSTIDNVTYADSIEWNKVDDKNTKSAESSSKAETTSVQGANGNIKTINEYTNKRKGNQGVNTYAHDMLEFRTLIEDITVKIINDERIANLFMNVW